MKLLTFSLQPFPGEDASGLRIEGTIGRRGNTLSIGCAILGNLSEVAIPSPAGLPGRRDRLWEETCLELFLAGKDSDRYREFNLSPAGHWNAYAFASYRKEMREEPAYASLPFHVRTEPGSLRFSLDLELEKILPAAVPIEVAVCAVLKTVAGRTSHWALSHPGPRPDFHRRKGFTLSFPAE